MLMNKNKNGCKIFKIILLFSHSDIKIYNKELFVYIFICSYLNRIREKVR